MYHVFNMSVMNMAAANATKFHKMTSLIVFMPFPAKNSPQHYKEKNWTKHLKY